MTCMTIAFRHYKQSENKCFTVCERGKILVFDILQIKYKKITLIRSTYAHILSAVFLAVNIFLFRDIARMFS